MKYPKLAVFAAACIIASCQPVAASVSNEACLQQSSLAELIMKKRQSGVSISTALKIGKGIGNVHFQQLIEALVQLAYLKPRYATKEYQEAAAVDFGTDVYNNCSSVK